jgi:hypothetical protein
MNLSELKRRTLEEWEFKDECSGSIAVKSLKDEIRQYGDLRTKQAWLRAWASLWVSNIASYVAYPRDLITIWFNSRHSWAIPEECRPAFLDALLTDKDGLYLVRTALEGLVNDEDWTQQQKEHCINGFFEMAQKSGRLGLPDGLVRRIAEDRRE